jgi:hypothetical protein
LVAGDALLKEADEIDEEDMALLWASLRTVMDAERRLNDLRIAHLEHVSPPKRDDVLGFGEEGRAQGFRELERIRLEIRWLRASGDALAREALADLRKPAAIARVSFHVVAFVALVWAAAFVRRRHAAWLRLVRNAAARSLRRPAALRFIQRATSAALAIGGDLVVLGSVLLLPVVTRLDVQRAPWSVFYSLLLWYALYRVALAVTHRTLAALAGRGDEVVAPATGEKILRSVRLVGRSAFVFAVLLASSAAVIGRGYLHGLVVRGAWLIGLFLATILMSRWRDDIAQAYLRVRPSGALSRMVSRTRTRAIGIVVAVAAFGFLLFSGVMRATRRFVLGFEQSRKALAYMFRRRLEKQVENSADDRVLLDPKLLAFFTEHPIDDGGLLVERFPGLDELEASHEAWRGGKRVGATLLVGRTGYGKTTWLRSAAKRTAETTATNIRLSERTTAPDEILAIVARAVGSERTDLDGLVTHLLAGERRVVVVDDAQLWFLRGVGTMEGWRTFELLVERTGDRVLWIVAFAHYAWELASWVGKGDHVFRSVVHLLPWSEAEITALLEKRNAASGLEIVYDDLIVDEMHGVDDDGHILTTARDYNRLVWDYAEGSPRAALHVWGRSLVPDGPGRARVRLFRNPEPERLEGLGESAKFAVAAIVWHERLSIDETAKTLLLPRAACEDAFARLLEADIAEELRDGQIRIAPRWWPVVVRYLRRKHLIET